MRRRSSITSHLLRASFGLMLILAALLALLPAKKLITVETSCLDAQKIQAAQDTTDSVALIRYVSGPQFSSEAAYFVPAAAISFSDSPVVWSQSYRGPPVLS